MPRERLDINLVNWDDPFEIDQVNRPHLYAHEPYGEEDLYDILVSLPRVIEADTDLGDADWFLVGVPPGCEPLTSPLTPPRSGDVRKVRPIGLYGASGSVLTTYLDLLDNGGGGTWL